MTAEIFDNAIALSGLHFTSNSEPGFHLRWSSSKYLEYPAHGCQLFQLRKHQVSKNVLAVIDLCESYYTRKTKTDYRNTVRREINFFNRDVSFDKVIHGSG
ncbi:hypothetical protein ACFLRB_01045, partial [Acidobacteriota bacterium]